MSSKKICLKTPKGTVDYNGYQMKIRNYCINLISTVFKQHGAEQIDTPVFELKEILMNKYGEDSKLIYDLDDQGGEKCSLRYDLTVPFARYVAMNNIKSMRRFQIAKVYRRDNPVITKGRFREFYQCDFDIAGEYDLMIADAECLYILSDILNRLKIGDFKIKINHRKLLDSIFEISGVPSDKYRLISSSIDKLDKLSWDEVKKEMIYKGLTSEIINNIHNFVIEKGPIKSLLEKLINEKRFNKSENALKVLDELKVLLNYTDAFGITDNIIFDLSLARGLDYYTGLIFEAVIDNKDFNIVGSVAGGGRYDNLVGMFGKNQIPSIGFSIGLERIFTIFEKIYSNKIVKNNTDIYVISNLKNRINCIEVCKMLWNEGIYTKFNLTSGISMSSQFRKAQNENIPIIILIGDDPNLITVKAHNFLSEQSIVKKDELIDFIKNIINSDKYQMMFKSLE